MRQIIAIEGHAHNVVLRAYRAMQTSVEAPAKTASEPDDRIRFAKAEPPAEPLWKKLCSKQVADAAQDGRIVDLGVTVGHGPKQYLYDEIFGRPVGYGGRFPVYLCR